MPTLRSFRAARSVPALALPALLLPALLLAGCTAADQAAETTAASKPAAESTPPATTEPAETAAPAAATGCEAALTDAGTAYVAEHGYQLFEDAAPYDPLATSIQAAGGAYCAWGAPNSEFAIATARIDFAPGTGATWESELAALGYTPNGDGTFTGPEDPSGSPSPVAVLADGSLVYVNLPIQVEHVEVGAL